MGLGRFALGAAALSIAKPPVLYSFPSVIRIATRQEVYRYTRDFGPQGATYTILFHVEPVGAVMDITSSDYPDGPIIETPIALELLPEHIQRLYADLRSKNGYRANPDVPK